MNRGNELAAKTKDKNMETKTETPAAPSVVLLGKEHDITAFASTDSTRYVLQSVHYNEEHKCLEAVNGRCLIRVPVQKSEDYPPISGTFSPTKDVIIPLAPFKKALASIPNGKSLPVLQNIALSSAEGKIRLTTNDLENEQSLVVKAVEGTYPNCEQVIPTKKPTFSIALSVHELQNIANYFAKHGYGDCSIRFEFTADCEAVRFSGKLASGKTATGVLMPMRMA